MCVSSRERDACKMLFLAAACSLALASDACPTASPDRIPLSCTLTVFREKVAEELEQDLTRELDLIAGELDTQTDTLTDFEVTRLLDEDGYTVISSEQASVRQVMPNYTRCPSSDGFTKGPKRKRRRNGGVAVERPALGDQPSASVVGTNIERRPSKRKLKSDECASKSDGSIARHSAIRGCLQDSAPILHLMEPTKTEMAGSWSSLLLLRIGRMFSLKFLFCAMLLRLTFRGYAPVASLLLLPMLHMATRCRSGDQVHSTHSKNHSRIAKIFVTGISCAVAYALTMAFTFSLVRQQGEGDHGTGERL